MPPSPIRIPCQRRELLCVTPQQTGDLAAQLTRIGWKPLFARTAEDACALAEQRQPRVALVDLSEPRLDAGVLDDLGACCPRAMRWIALMSPAGLERRELCARVGRLCYDFHTLPVDWKRLAVTLGRAFGLAELLGADGGTNGRGDGCLGIIGHSAAVRSLRESIVRLAVSDAPLLITGESGTGKELTAAAVHRLSRREAGPFVPVNCGALPANLIQSELFGYERGAFTGADRRVVGKIESAHTGTLFLDEIGDLSGDLQVNLLRVLQEHCIQRVGGHVDIPLDLRVLAATHVDLEQAVAEGRFREDLYYRLNVLHLALPPLRERLEDIEPLAWHVLDSHASERRAGVRGFSPRALTAMRLHRWPGNVRELINRVRRAMIVADRPLISPTDLGLDHLLEQRGVQTLERVRAEAEIAALELALTQTGGNIAHAARQLGVARATLYRLMYKHGVEPPPQGSTSASETETEAPGADTAAASLASATVPRRPAAGPNPSPRGRPEGAAKPSREVYPKP